MFEGEEITIVLDVRRKEIHQFQRHAWVYYKQEITISYIYCITIPYSCLI